MVKLSKIAIKKTWIPLVNIISTTSDEMDKEITYKAGCKEQIINRNDLLRAQMIDAAVRRMIESTQKKKLKKLKLYTFF